MLCLSPAAQRLQQTQVCESLGLDMLLHMLLTAICPEPNLQAPHVIIAAVPLLVLLFGALLSEG